MSDSIAIDTNLWLYSYIEPTDEESEKLHGHAKKFLVPILKDPEITICLSSYQLGEILEVLRRMSTSQEIRDHLLQDFLSEGFFIKGLTVENVTLSYKKSRISNIHIYDYLVAIPLKGIITKIYSADDHFQHKDFQEIAEVINPISPWILREGRRPERRD
ncbi:PIN domain-containing protein [bacterium]|nr:PIN domain-containing protein [bacterium]MBU1600145.1 PIN domain-containing protein [bacterium]MBU2461822.1 PIN domain-containing protein [bacterium]